MQAAQQRARMAQEKQKQSYSVFDEGDDEILMVRSNTTTNFEHIVALKTSDVNSFMSFQTRILL